MKLKPSGVFYKVPPYRKLQAELESKGRLLGEEKDFIRALAIHLMVDTEAARRAVDVLFRSGDLVKIKAGKRHHFLVGVERPGYRGTREEGVYLRSIDADRISHH